MPPEEYHPSPRPLTDREYRAATVAGSIALLAIVGALVWLVYSLVDGPPPSTDPHRLAVHHLEMNQDTLQQSILKRQPALGDEEYSLIREGLCEVEWQRSFRAATFFAKCPVALLDENERARATASYAVELEKTSHWQWWPPHRILDDATFQVVNDYVDLSSIRLQHQLEPLDRE